MTDTADKKWRILCIDDEPDILEILRVSLGMKHEVLGALNGLDAVGMLDYADADFILCDVRMPKMDGFQTVEAIRKHPDYMTIPVFFLTAEQGAESAKKGYAAGGNLYLTKPFDPMRVLQNIDYFLQESGQQPRKKRLTVEEVKKKAAQQGDAEEAPASAEGVPRVIMICKHEDEARRYHRALKDHYESVPCADPLSSLQRLFRYEPDLLVVNPGVPQLSGWGLVQMIKQNKQFRKLPILLIEDRERPLDERLLPTITKLPLLAPSATSSEILESVERAVKMPNFRIHPKKMSYQNLMEEEEKIRKYKATEEARKAMMEENVRQRYERIQGFINKNS